MVWGLPADPGPQEDLKIFQVKLVKKLDDIYRPRTVVFGFVEGRSIVGNAERHVACRYVLNVDLKDSFPTIDYGRVWGLFKSFGASEKAATVLAQICCHKGKLPHGAPTSPVVSNMICVKMDRLLTELAKEHNCKYSRVWWNGKWHILGPASSAEARAEDSVRKRKVGSVET